MDVNEFLQSHDKRLNEINVQTKHMFDVITCFRLQK